MSHAEKRALIEPWFDLLDGLEKRRADVEKRGVKTSRNSSRPPSSDGLKRPAAAPRQAGVQRPGGQPGPVGMTRAWHDSPDAARELRPEGCCGCGLPLADQWGVIGEGRQPIEIPEPKVHVTEYRQSRVTCAGGGTHRGTLPVGITPHVSDGPRLKAYAVGRVDGHGVALARMAEIIGAQAGRPPSGGTLQRWIGQAAAALRPDYAAIRQGVIAADVAHVDERGMRGNGQTQWRHVAGTTTRADYTIHPRRGLEAMTAAGLRPGFTGHAVHDHGVPYFHCTQVTHSRCRAHRLRERRDCEDATAGHHGPARRRDMLITGKTAVEQACAAGQEAVDATTGERVLVEYDRWVTLGLWVVPEPPKALGQKGRPQQDPATHRLRRLRDFRTELWRFLHAFRVPFDNNLAERLVRPVKVKLNVAGGFRAVGGAEAFCIRRSVWQTDTLQGINPFDTLRAAFAGAE